MVCRECGEDKSVEEFGVSKRTKTGYRSLCRLCAAADRRKYSKSSGRHTKDGQRWTMIKYNYGVTKTQYQIMREAQANCCAICGKEEDVPNRNPVAPLSVDHDHRTNAVRGLLCHRCNCALGLFDDDKNTLRKAIEYLQARESVV